MKKIYIVGIVASGKTTFAKRLSQHLNIPWFELDTIVHGLTNGVRIKRSPEEQLASIRDIDSQGAWILEGTDRKSYQCLFEMADTIILLDPPLWIRRTRILSRYVKQQVGLEKSHYTSDLNMLRMMFKWTSDFERNREEFEKKMDLHKNKVMRITDKKRLKSLLLS